jgi:hypothetical protein
VIAVSDEPNLAVLIADRKGTRSYDRLAEDCGGTPSSGRLHQMATRPLKNFPDPDSIRGMANGLGVTVTDIVMAAARSLDLPVYTGNDPSALSIGGAGTLPDSAKEALTSVAREFIKLTSQHETDGEADAQVTESRTEESSPELGRAGGKARKSGAPMTPAEHVQAEDLTLDNQGVAPDDAGKQNDYALARRAGETEERRRRRIEGEPWDQADPEGPETGA